MNNIRLDGQRLHNQIQQITLVAHNQVTQMEWYETLKSNEAG